MLMNGKRLLNIIFTVGFVQFFNKLYEIYCLYYMILQSVCIIEDTVELKKIKN